MYAMRRGAARHLLAAWGERDTQMFFHHRLGSSLLQNTYNQGHRRIDLAASAFEGMQAIAPELDFQDSPFLYRCVQISGG